MQLTACQENARREFFEFIKSNETAMILEGHAGTGKTTLVSHLIKEVRKIDILKNSINPDELILHKTVIQLTATTNKAAEALEQATGEYTRTIHSYLDILVRTDYHTGKTYISRKREANSPVGAIIFIDEASYIDPRLLAIIQSATAKSKVIYMGDPTQLTPVNCVSTPAFDQNIRRVKLSQVVRQDADNPIQELSTGLREHILGAPFPKCVPDGKHIIHLPRYEFNNTVVREFSRPDWKASDSRFLAWTNKTVISYNKHLHAQATGRPEFKPGDQVINNHYINNRKGKLKTDQLVTLFHVGEPREMFGVKGRSVGVSELAGLFMPDNPADIDKAGELARMSGLSDEYQHILATWVDFRPAYACTVNKSQGSTYGTAFIDLDDISKNRDSDQLARMLYVAISRAKETVYLTGDIT